MVLNFIECGVSFQAWVRTLTACAFTSRTRMQDVSVPRPSYRWRDQSAQQSPAHAAIVSDVAVGDVASYAAGRRLDARVSAEDSLVGNAAHLAINGVVLKSEDATLTADLALPCVRHTGAAEAVLSGHRVEQQHSIRIAVILEADIE